MPLGSFCATEGPSLQEGMDQGLGAGGSLLFLCPPSLLASLRQPVMGRPSGLEVTIEACGSSWWPRLGMWQPLSHLC